MNFVHFEFCGCNWCSKGFEPFYAGTVDRTMVAFEVYLGDIWYFRLPSIQSAEKFMEWKPVCKSCKNDASKYVSSCSLLGVK